MFFHVFSGALYFSAQESAPGVPELPGAMNEILTYEERFHGHWPACSSQMASGQHVKRFAENSIKSCFSF